MDKKWKTLETREIHKDQPWLYAKALRCALPNGEILDPYYVLDYPDWVFVIAINLKNEFVFVEQYRHAMGDNSLELCAGVIDPGEEPIVAAKRELLEETGYAKGEWSLLCTFNANPATHTNWSYCFVAKKVEKVQEQDLEPTEEIDVFRYSKNQTLNLLRHNKIKQSMHAAALWQYLDLLNDE